MVKRPAIGTEGKPVGDEKTADHRHASAPPIVVVQASGGAGRVDRILHAADPETALTVAAAVIQPIFQQTCLGLRQRCQRRTCKIIAPNARLERN